MVVDDDNGSYTLLSMTTVLWLSFCIHC